MAVVRAVVWAAMAAVLMSVSASACGDVHRRPDDGGDDGDDGDDDDGGDDGGGSFSLTLAAARVLVRQGATADIAVTVERADGFDEAIAVSVDGLPSGVTAEQVTIAAGETSGTIVLSAESDSPQGASAPDVTGSSEAGTDSAALRLLVGGPPGTLDASFADAGLFVRQIGNLPTLGRGIALQPGTGGDRILVTGSADVSGGSATQAVTLRLDEAGALDDTFGSGGIVSTGIDLEAGGIAIVVSPSGRILLAGWGGGDGVGHNSALFAYDADGVPDTDFGSGGTARLNTGNGHDEARRLLEYEDGSLLMVAHHLAGPASSATSYTAAGEPDGDLAITAADGIAQTALLDADGNLVLAGQMENQFWIARYLDDGSPDSSLDADGDSDGQIVLFLGDSSTIHGLMPASGGRLLAVGVSAADPDGSVVSLARINSNGSPDLAFGDSGELRTPVPFTTSAPNAITVDADGRILIAGTRPTAASSLFVVARLGPDGAVDETFGDSGSALADFAVDDTPDDGAYGITVDSDGRILVSGTIGPADDESLAVARFWP